MSESSARIGIYADDKASPTVKSVQGLMAGLGTEAKKSILTGVGLAGGVAAFALLKGAAGAAIGYLGDAVKAASDLNESQSKAKVVFGESASVIEKWAKDAATNMGMSTQAALEAAGTFGNLFTAMKISLPAATDMSKGIIQLAADLASFNNQNPEDVLIALRAGLVGETEPLRKFGINLNAAAIAAEAVNLGLASNVNNVSTAAKAQAAYSLIMKQSTTAQGDFARTADGLANTQRTLDAQMADLSAQIGQALLPIMAQLAKFARDTLVPALKDFVNAAIAIPSAIGEAAAAVQDFLNFGEEASAGLHSSGEILDRLRAQFGGFGAGVVADAQQARWGAKVSAIMAGDLTAAAPVVLKSAFGTLRDPIFMAVQAGATKAHDEAAKIPQLMGDAMLARQEDLTNSIKTLIEFMGKALTPAQERAQAFGYLHSKAYEQGMNSGIPAVVAKATELRNLALQVLVDTARANDGGVKLGQAWMNGIIAGIASRKSSLSISLTKMKAMIYGNSPPPEGPLRDIDKGGYNIGKAWLQGVNEGMGGGLKLPSIPGLSGGGGMSLAGAGGGGAAPIHIHIEGPVFGDGPFLDMLANRISDRLRFAPGT